MAMRFRVLAAVAVVLAISMVAVVCRQGRLSAEHSQRPDKTSSAASSIPDFQARFGNLDTEEFIHLRAHSADSISDPLLVDGLRDTLEVLLFEAGEVSEPAALKQRLAELIGKHFPTAFSTRALALAERYVDYRVALGQLRTPQNLTDPRALRAALQTRQKIRQQFFNDAEYAALFAREAELDRYTLARLEVAHNSQLTAEQRAQALQTADHELSQERLAERNAATEQLSVAAQTAIFNAQNTDDYTRHTARSAQYGEAVAHSLAELDRQEQHWQQRLDLYSQARVQQGEQSAPVQQLRQQLFSNEELQRVDAALALRKLQATAAAR